MVLEFITNSGWVRSDAATNTESGHSALYASTNGIVRQKPTSEIELKSVQMMLDYFAELQGGTLSVFASSDDETFLNQIAQLGEIHPHVIFEGYATLSKLERADLNNRAIQILNGKSVIAGAEVSDAWNNKVTMRKETMRILGEHAVPEGKSLDKDQLNEAIKWSDSFPGKHIVKVLGAGGMGNIVVLPGQTVDAAELGKRINSTQTEWISCEAWVPWTHTGCVSFFITPDGSIHNFALVEQVLKPDSGFTGSTSNVTCMSREDQSTVFQYAREIINVQQNNGMMAFSGLDWILLADPTMPGLILPSGKKIQFIEATARLGGHNQELVGIGKIIMQKDANPNDFVHMRVGIRNRPEGINDFNEMLAWLKSNGFPVLDCNSDPNQMSLFVDNYGPTHNKYYEAVVGFTKKEDAASLVGAFHKLREMNVIW